MIKQGQNLDELVTQFAKVGSTGMCGYDMCHFYTSKCWCLRHLHIALLLAFGPVASISESIDRFI